MGDIQDTFTVLGLDFTQGGVEFVWKEGHGNIHDENGGCDDVGRHGKRMLQTNHQTDEQAQGFIMGVCTTKSTSMNSE